VRPESGSPCSPLSVLPPPASFQVPEWPEAKLQRARRRALVPPRWTVRPGPDPSRVDSVHWIIHCKIIRYSELFQRSCKKVPGLFVNQPAIQILYLDPWSLKTNSRYTPSHYQKLQIGPYNFLSPYLCNRNSDFGDSCAKILRITSSFILCIH
jgi:hypothetical protein